jgi:hypothetical protein
MSKKGRPRKEGVKRTKSGRASRAASAYNENAEAIALRMKVFGMTEAEARDQKAATYIGRLCLTGVRRTTDGITQAQYEAAQAYLSAYEQFQRAVKSPDALRSSEGAASGPETDSYAAWCRNAIGKWEKIQYAVMIEQGFHENRGANMWAALDYLVLRDQQHPHMVGDLRLALNAVGHHLGIIAKPKRIREQVAA